MRRNNSTQAVPPVEPANLQPLRRQRPTAAEEGFAVRIQVVVVSDDQKYCLGILNEISKMKHDVTVREMGWTDIGDLEPQQLMQAEDTQYSTILIFDFGFVRRACETLIERTVALKRRMAIECLAIRPPADDNLRRRLVNWDVLMFDIWPSSIQAQVVH